MSARNKILLLLITAFIAISCSKKKPTIPGDVLNEQEMTSLLTDIHLAQAAMTVNATADSSRYSMKQYTDYILNQHKISNEKYVKSLRFYTENPGLIKSIYDSVLTNLSKMQREAAVE